MPDLFRLGVFSERPYEESLAGEYARDEQRRSLFLDDDLLRGHAPWCRVCRQPVPYYRWWPAVSRQEGSVGFAVCCHGTSMAGVLLPRMPITRFRLEVFCEDFPHMDMAHIWWVGLDGDELQPSKIYRDNAIKQGGYFNSSFGRWARRYGGFFGAGAGLLSWLLWATWRAMH